MKYDFGGYATKANVRCSDGRKIEQNAFVDCDGAKVPLVWQHLRDDPANVLGHAILENRSDGVYAYGKFNDTEKGQLAKHLVEHGDLCALSIYANHLTQRGSNVTHGTIREVSLVMAGANPGALIDDVSVSHADNGEEESTDSAIMYLNSEIEHADGIEVPDRESDQVEHADEKDQNEGKEKTVKEVFDSLTEDQKVLFYAMVGQALEEGSEDEVEQSDYDDEGGIHMKKNVFEGKDADTGLSHEDRASIFTAAVEHADKYHGLLSDYLTEVALEHGITDIESLFPDYKSLNNPPAWIGQPDAWVNAVWNGTTKTPFSRIKSSFADITKDEARARGYIKGKKKIEEQFSLLKRTTDPQTVYKKQSLDRDDIIDITDFDVVAWLKSEMRMKLQEELSRAILIGDGRLASDDSKIQETHIRSILNDSEFYVIHHTIEMSDSMDATAKANAIIDGAVMAMVDYKGSGSASGYMSPQTLASLRLARDKNGRRLYNSVDEISSAVGVSGLVDVPPMKDLTRVANGKTYKVLGIIVNMRDYTVGADRGGQTTMFDDFNIDYNKYQYLIETRCSGALTKPASAIVLEVDVTPPTPPTPPTSDSDEESVG